MVKRITSIKTLAARAAVTLFLALLTTATAWADITPTAPSQDGDGNYLIGTAAELYGFAEIVNNGNTSANAKLTADIVVNENVLDANGEANTGDFVQWISIGNNDQNMTYSGTFDGQGHTISGLYVSVSGWYVGFIGKVSGSAVVKNLGIVDSYFSSSNNFLGSIVGGVSYSSSVTLANVYSTSTVKGDNWIGGLAGGGDGSVSVVNSYFAGKTSAGWSYGTHHDDLVSGDFHRSTLTVCNVFVLGTSQYGTSVTAGQLSDGTSAAALHYYQDALADGSMFGISDGKTTFSGSLEGVSVTTADITLHTFDGDATAYSSKYVVGNATPLPVNVVREGYTFLGWYDNANFEGDAVTQISSSETGNKEYWAKFVRSHSVSFVLNGGTIQKGEIDHYIEGEATTLPTVLTKNGASFEGWYTDENFTGDRYYSIPSTATEDMTFYAKWGAAKTTFYLVQGGSPEPVNILYEGENVVYLDKTTMDGYYVNAQYGNCWGGFSGSVNVPYTGGESTFGNGGRSFNVSQSGFYVFTLTDKGEGNWFVSVLRSMNNCTVADITDQTYTGSAISPEVTVTDGVTTLTLDTDYTIEYSDNTNVGTATATITGIGNYSGTIEKTFTITPKPVTVKNDQNEDVPAATGDATITQDENGITLTLITPTGTDAPQTVSIPTAVEVDHVTIQRTYVSGKASTVYLPFSIEVSKLSGGTFHTFTNVDQTTSPWTVNYSVALASTATLDANTPYLFLPDGTNEGKIVVNNGSDKVSVCTANPQTTTQGQWEFIGTYEPIVWASEHADLGKVYGFAAIDKEVEGKNITAGQFVKAAAGASIAPMRAYLKYTPLLAAPARGISRGAATDELPATMRVVIAGANGETTEVGTIGIEQYSGEWYTIDGRKLSGAPTKKGLYIHNGRKNVIK